MTDELKARINAALDRFEDIEHRVNSLIEGNRQQLSHVVSDLKIPELRNELRAIARAMK